MDKTVRTKKIAADKIAFLGLLIAALLIARLIIASRAAIVLSEPIVLEYSGVSIAVPTGQGWRSEYEWLYQDDRFSLNSIFVPQSTNPSILVHCQYLLASEEITAKAMFDRRAMKIRGSIEETGQTETGTLTLEWAHIQKTKNLFNTFIGTVLLPNNRRLNIEVDEVTGDAEAARRLFSKIAETVNFEDNRLLAAGTDIVSSIKSTGLDRFLHDTDRQSLFLVKDAARRTIGFTTELLVDSQQNHPLNIRGVSLVYMPGRYALELASVFHSDNSFDEFEWHIESVGLTRSTGTEITAQYQGPITVKRIGSQAMEKSYHPGGAMIPVILVNMVFEQMLDSNYEKIAVDVIKTDGTIAPMIISRAQAKDKAGDTEKIEYALRAELLDGRGFSELTFFDSQKQIVGSILKQDRVYLFERTDMATILTLFPQQAEYFLKKEKSRKQNGQ